MSGEGISMAQARKAGTRAAVTIALLLAATGCALFMNRGGIGKECVIMVYLVGVLLTTVATRGYLYGVLSSLVSVLVFNYLFTEPRYTFLVHSTQDLMLLAFFEITAIVSGSITSRLSRLMETAERNERTAQTLCAIAEGFLNGMGERGIVEKGLRYIREYTGQECGVALESVPARRFGMPEREDERSFVIPGVSSRALGWLKAPPGPMDARAELIFKTVATQMGIALEREHAYQEREDIRVAMERERMRSNLLRSVAHDLRSPLTALSGASTLLADDFERLSDEEKKRLAGDISEEMVWLSNLVENILNMTRINETRLELTREDEVVDDVVGEAAAHMSRLLRTRRFRAVLPDEVLVASMDGRLIVQALVNLLDNAVKHTPPDSEIELSVFRKGNRIVFCVADTGDGVDESVRDNLFEGFVTSDHGRSDSKRGMGLGLAICRAVAEAHGGEIHMEPNEPKGSRFVLSLPMEDQNAHSDD